MTAFQSTPSGTLIVVTVGVRAPATGTKHSKPMDCRPENKQENYKIEIFSENSLLRKFCQSLVKVFDRE